MFHFYNAFTHSTVYSHGQNAYLMTWLEQRVLNRNMTTILQNMLLKHTFRSQGMWSCITMFLTAVQACQRRVNVWLVRPGLQRLPQQSIFTTHPRKTQSLRDFLHRNLSLAALALSSCVNLHHFPCDTHASPRRRARRAVYRTVDFSLDVGWIRISLRYSHQRGCRAACNWPCQGKTHKSALLQRIHVYSFGRHFYPKCFTSENTSPSINTHHQTTPHPPPHSTNIVFPFYYMVS